MKISYSWIKEHINLDLSLDELAEIYPFQEVRFSKYCNGIELFNKV